MAISLTRSMFLGWRQSAVVALLFLLFCAGPAGSASLHPFTGFFRGALDNRIPVTLSLTQDGERVRGVLVYDRVGTDIAVDGRITSNGALTLSETGPTGKQTGHWTLRFDPGVSTDAMAGRWNDPSGGRGYAVSLSREIPLAAEPIAYLPISAGESLYREQTSGSVAWRLAPVGHTGLRFPRVIRLASPRVQARINQILAQSVHELLSCNPFEATVTFDVWEFDATVTYAGHDVFSIWNQGIGYCPGAAHPFIFNLSTTFDLQTGREVEFNKLFANYDRDREQILGALFGGRIEGAQTAEEVCASVYTLEHLSDIVYAFGRDGLIVEPEFTHVVASCAERVIVPYRTLKPFARPDGPLARVTR